MQVGPAQLPWTDAGCHRSHCLAHGHRCAATLAVSRRCPRAWPCAQRSYSPESAPRQPRHHLTRLLPACPALPAGTEVAGFKLPEDSYEEGAVNAARGSFAITNATAERFGGEMRAVFTVSMPGRSAASLAAAPLNYIYAVGPMGASAAPGLADHASEWLRCWSAALCLRAAMHAHGGVCHAAPACLPPARLPSSQHRPRNTSHPAAVHVTAARPCARCCSPWVPVRQRLDGCEAGCRTIGHPHNHNRRGHRPSSRRHPHIASPRAGELRLAACGQLIARPLCAAAAVRMRGWSALREMLAPI